MARKFLLLGLAAGALTLAGCATDGYYYDSYGYNDGYYYDRPTYRYYGPTTYYGPRYYNPPVGLSLGYSYHRYR